MPQQRPLVIPPTPGACADLAYRLRQQRLEMQRKVDAIQADETAIINHIIDILPKSKAEGITGRQARAEIHSTRKAQVVDWDKFRAYIWKNKFFEMMQKRLADNAVMERITAGENVPGVQTITIKTVSLTKRRA